MNNEDENQPFLPLSARPCARPWCPYHSGATAPKTLLVNQLVLATSGQKEA